MIAIPDGNGEYIVMEEYKGEVKDLMLEAVEEGKIDEIPDEWEIDGGIYINPKDFLSDRDMYEIELKIEEEANDSVSLIQSS